VPPFRFAKTLSLTLPAVVAALAVKKGLPRLLRVAINKALRRRADTRGSVDAVYVHPVAGLIAVAGIRLTAPGVPLFTLRRATVRWSWARLLRGQVVGEIILDTPRVHIAVPAPGASPAPSRPPTGADWRAKMENLPLFLLQRVVVQEGAVHLLRETGATRLSFPVRDIDVAVSNVTNSRRLSSSPAALGRVYARVADAPLSVNFEAALLADRPTYSAGARLTNLDLPPLNDWLREFAGIEFEGGRLSTTVQTAGREGRLSGDAKIAVDDARLKAHPGASVKKRLRETLLRAALKLFENNLTKRVATEVRFSGEWPRVRPRLGLLVRQALRNAFAEPLPMGPAVTPGTAGGRVFRRSRG